MSAGDLLAGLPSMSAAEWNDARTVHQIAVRQNSTLLCFYCHKQLLQHTGPARVIPDDDNPESPKVFGSPQCEATWRSWQEHTARQPSSHDVTGLTIGTYEVDGVHYLASDVPNNKRARR
ncbi:hypothetical protein [Micromonospora sp. RV43]|uniref:hypothetical protein n=1 Tax=Micromonospora sp. RV43 TaxID=1661387 RepID=UPI00064C1E02|nr:hypothetical protein [Micromonospora sp. RV43]